jgi:hypothetical protein
LSGASLALVALLGALAHAGEAKVFVNGVPAVGLAGQTLEGVDVRFAADGSVWIDAPRYKIETSADAPTVGAVPKARYWLVSQDADSQGHAVDIIVNGTAVATARSGGGALIIDLAPYLHLGTNQIELHATAAPDAKGGPLSVHVGVGENRRGTIDLANPEVSLVRRAGRADRRTSQRGQLVVR